MIRSDYYHLSDDENWRAPYGKFKDSIGKGWYCTGIFASVYILFTPNFWISIIKSGTVIFKNYT